jgi:hypothetical protein
MSRPALIPTAHNEAAAWERYAAIARRVVNEPSLLCDRRHCEELAFAWSQWRDLFLVVAN